MDGVSPIAETPKSTLKNSPNVISDKVFQPPKLREIVEVIDLMGTVASRVREDKRGDLPVTGTAAAGTGTGQTGTTARDEAIAKIPTPEIMQQKLVEHIRKEVRTVEKQAKKLGRSQSPGSAYLLSELYRKIRRLSSLISELLAASTEMIKRFYVSIFIDRHPIIVSDGVSKEKST
ncbi:hypothetical protein EXS65_02020 [Candidatus Peribacteria bacterium]|nr:hypothetical protein [Candidatus Peribacteria bacterium]